jgi:hypothetical protein
MKSVIKFSGCLLIVLGFTFFNTVSASSKIKLLYPASPHSLADIKLTEFIKLTAKDYSRLTGKKMNLKEKLSFMFMKKDMKHALKKNPGLTVSGYFASVDKKTNTVLLIILIVVALLLILFLIALGSANTWI